MRKLTIFLLVIVMLLVGCASTQTPSTAIDNAARGTTLAAVAHGTSTAAGQAAGMVAMPLVAVSVAKDIKYMPGFNRRETTEDEKALMELVLGKDNPKREWTAQKCREILKKIPETYAKPHEQVIATETFPYTAEVNNKTYEIQCIANPVYKDTNKRFIYFNFLYEGKPVIRQAGLLRVIDLNQKQQDANNN